MGSTRDRLKELEVLYRSRFGQFVRTAAAITGGVESGADAVHDAFLSCVRGLDGFRGDGPLEAWVWKAVVNSALRIREREQRTFSPASATALPESLNTDPDRGLGSLRSVVAALPDRQRLILFLRYYADLDYQMIAETLEISVGTVGSALNQAHEAIRAAVIKEAFR